VRVNELFTLHWPSAAMMLLALESNTDCFQQMSFLQRFDSEALCAQVTIVLLSSLALTKFKSTDI